MKMIPGSRDRACAPADQGRVECEYIVPRGWIEAFSVSPTASLFVRESPADGAFPAYRRLRTAGDAQQRALQDI